MIIQHNIMALNSNNRLASNNTQVSKNLEKLSSGYKINRAGDDAAGLAISEKMRAQITGLSRASQNAQDGVSLVQTAEGNLTEVHSMLNRMVDLATQASNGTYDGNVDRKNLQKEVQALKDEIDRIAETSNFNGIKLLDGGLGSGGIGAKVSVAADGTAKNAAFTYELTGEKGVKVDFKAIAGADADAGVTAAWSGSTLTFTIASNAAGSSKITQAQIDAAIKAASGAPEIGKGIGVKLGGDISFSAASEAQTTAFGGGEAKLAKNATATGGGVTVTSTRAGLDTRTLTFNQSGSIGASVDASNGNVGLNLEASKAYTAADINSMLSKVDAKMTVSFDGTLTGAQLDGKGGGAGTDGIYELGADGTAGEGLAGGGLNLQIGDTADQRVSVVIGNMNVNSLGLAGVDVSTESNASTSMQMIKDAINSVSGTRADLGAIQNRLEHTINNLTTTTENMTAAESRIRDTNMAQEMMAFTKNNVLAQAAQAMLAQANQQPQQVLQLLR